MNNLKVPPHFTRRAIVTQAEARLMADRIAELEEENQGLKARLNIAAALVKQLHHGLFNPLTQR